MVARLIGDLPPSASFTAAPNPVGVGKPVTFYGAGSTDPDGTVVSYSWNFGDGATSSAGTPSHPYGAPGTYNATLTVTDDDSVRSSTTRAITVLASPRFTHISQTAKQWRLGKLLPHFARKRKRKPPVGTTFAFSLNEVAQVRFAFTQTLPGRRAGRRCVAPTKRNKHKHKCSRTITAGTLTFATHPGINKVRFQGRLSRNKKLKPGRYTLVITATNALGQHATAKLAFTIVKG
jgi:PKD repeat protein